MKALAFDLIDRAGNATAEDLDLVNPIPATEVSASPFDIEPIIPLQFPVGNSEPQTPIGFARKYLIKRYLMS